MVIDRGGKTTPARGTQRAPAEAVGEWHNTSEWCDEDDTQTIVNNKLGAEKEVSLTIENMGKCPVLVGRAPQEGDFSGGENIEIKKGKQRVHVTLPQGQFLMASCRNEHVDGCNWSITDVRP